MFLIYFSKTHQVCLAVVFFGAVCNDFFYRRPAEEKAVHSGSRKKRAVEPSAEHLPAYDSDEEARLAELESSKELANKKVYMLLLNFFFFKLFNGGDRIC